MDQMKQLVVRRMLMALLLVTLMALPGVGAAATLPSGYTSVSSIQFNANNHENMIIPYELASQPNDYSWELTFSDLTKLYSTASLVGVYNGSRSGYVYSNAGTSAAPQFGACIGNSHYKVNKQIGGSSTPNTLTASYTFASQHYSLSDTAGIANETSTWSGTAATGRCFTMTNCAGIGYNEWASFTFYGLRIYEGSTLMVDMVPAIRDSDSKPGAYDTVSGSFIELVSNPSTTSASPDTACMNAVSPTAASANDGRITGVNNAMAYSTDGGSTWTNVTGSIITGLPAGQQVQVKYRGTSALLESTAVTLTIPQYVPPAPAPVPPAVIPNTGDNSPLLLWAALLLLSVAGVGLILRRK